MAADNEADDAEPALREQSVEVGSDSPFEGMIDLLTADFGERRAVDSAVR